MISPVSETFGQARQGSVAAIIQVLNEQLASSGIRTRAVVADGMLQILCEAAEAKQLEQKTVVSRVRSVLESISPSRIRKVKINSRIVKEEQLLWLEEINRDPENALLWSEVIVLQQPFFVQRWMRDRNLKPAAPLIKDVTDPKASDASLSSKVIGGLGLVALLLGALWLFREDLGMSTTSAPSVIEGTETQLNSSTTAAVDDAEQDPADRTSNTTPSAPPSSTTAQSAQQPAPDEPNATPTGGSSGPTEDAFAEAVRIAEKAAIDGLTASASAEWLDLASRWQRAADLMSEIPEGNDRYTVARDRVSAYQANSKAALQQANAASPE